MALGNGVVPSALDGTHLALALRETDGAVAAAAPRFRTRGAAPYGERSEPYQAMGYKYGDRVAVIKDRDLGHCRAPERSWNYRLDEGEGPRTSAYCSTS
jgi:hypothetical protein